MEGAMKVRELIEQLQAQDPDLPVVCFKDPDSVFSVAGVDDTHAAIELHSDGTPFLDFGNLPGDHFFNTAKVLIVISPDIDCDF